MTLTATPVCLGRYAPGTHEWAELRRARIGGSEIADVIGLGFGSRYQLYWEKAIGLTVEPDRAETERMYWGTAQEPIIVQRFADDLAVADPDAIVEYGPGSYIDPDESWMLATPDAIVWRGDDWRAQHVDELLEVKTAARADGWGPDTYPPQYRCQQLWQMRVMGVRRSRLVVKIGSADYRVYPTLDMDEDPDAEDDLAFLIERGRAFVADLTARRDPVPGDGSEATWETVRRLHPDIESGTRAGVPADLAAEWLWADRLVKEAAADKRMYAARILDVMGSAQHAHAVGADGEADADRFGYRTWKTQADGTPGVPYLAADRKTVKAMTIKDLRTKETT